MASGEATRVRTAAATLSPSVATGDRAPTLSAVHGHSARPRPPVVLPPFVPSPPPPVDAPLLPAGLGVVDPPTPPAEGRRGRWRRRGEQLGPGTGSRRPPRRRPPRAPEAPVLSGVPPRGLPRRRWRPPITPLVLQLLDAAPAAAPVPPGAGVAVEVVVVVVEVEVQDTQVGKGRRNRKEVE